jgi:hypothetical protein
MVSALNTSSVSVCGEQQEGYTVAMYTAYFDASGEKSHEWLIVFGFVAEAEQWKRFDGAWAARLSRDGLSYLHMWELPDQQIAGTRRESLISDLTKIIEDHVLYRFGCGMEFSVYENARKSTKIEELIGHAYALCGRDAVNQAHKWRKDHHRDELLQIVFDDGDTGKEYLVKALAEIGKDKNFGFNSANPDKKIAQSQGVMPLQAADLAAWHWRRHKELERSDKLFQRHARIIRRLSKIPGRCTTYKNPEEIKVLADLGAKARSLASLWFPLR